MTDYLACAVIVLLGFGLVAMARRSLTRQEHNLFLIAFLAHVASGVAQIILGFGYIGEGGDIVYYVSEGDALARALEHDFGRVGPLLAELLLQSNNDLPMGYAGTPTGSMCALSAFLLYGLGHSRFALGMLVAVAAFFGHAAMYRVFRDWLPNERKQALIASLFTPSVVFWSAGFVKESIALIGLGVLMLGVHRILRGRILSGLVLLPSALLVGLFKPYILFPFTFAVALWFAWSRLRNISGRLRTIIESPLYIALAAVAAVVAMVALTRLFPDYSIDKFTTRTGELQSAGGYAQGGSYFTIMPDSGPESLPQALAYAPLALAASLFRPFLFEVKNPLMLVSALETTALMILLVRAVLRGSVRRTLRTVLGEPMLVMSAAFTVIFAVAVGLVTTNMGTLSRYRTPLLPFYVLIILVLDVRARQWMAEGAKRPLLRRRPGVGPRRTQGDPA